MLYSLHICGVRTPSGRTSSDLSDNIRQRMQRKSGLDRKLARFKDGGHLACLRRTSH
jgi:hypothetical protein